MSAEVPQQEQVRYVVLAQVVVPSPGESDQLVWCDVAEIEVPPRTKRKTVVKLALQAANGEIEGGGTKERPHRIRVLGPEDAEVLKVYERPRDPELVIEVDE